VTVDEIVLLALRLAMVLVLYLFLAWAVRALLADLRAAPGEVERRAAAPAGRLVLLDGATAGQPTGRVLGVQAVTTVGRAGDNAVVLDDEYVSAHHAVLRREGDTWWLSDLGSTNGTWADGERVDAPVALRPGVTLRFGRLRARFEA
jgi:hypothetical protein